MLGCRWSWLLSDDELNFLGIKANKSQIFVFKFIFLHLSFRIDASDDIFQKLDFSADSIFYNAYIPTSIMAYNIFDVSKFLGTRKIELWN